MIKADQMIKAAFVVRAHDLVRHAFPTRRSSDLGERDRDELRDLLRRCIAGLSPEEADAALVVRCPDVCTLETDIEESCGPRRTTPEEIEEENHFAGTRERRSADKALDCCAREVV